MCSNCFKTAALPIIDTAKNVFHGGDHSVLKIIITTRDSVSVANFACTYCPFMTLSLYEYVNHINLHKNETYKLLTYCPICIAFPKDNHRSWRRMHHSIYNHITTEHCDLVYLTEEHKEKKLLSGSEESTKNNIQDNVRLFWKLADTFDTAHKDIMKDFLNILSDFEAFPLNQSPMIDRIELAYIYKNTKLLDKCMEQLKTAEQRLHLYKENRERIKKMNKRDQFDLAHRILDITL